MPKTKIFIAIFLALIWALSLKISLAKTDSELLNSFSKSKESRILHSISGFDTAKKVLVFVPFELPNADTTVQQIAQEMKQNNAFSGVFFKLTDAGENVKDYFKNNYIYIVNADFTKFEDISGELKKLKTQSENPFDYKPIDKNDPFGVFSLKTGGFENKDGMLTAGDKGYLIIAGTKADITDSKASRELENACKALEGKYKGSVFFAPHFFSAENSQIIESKVKMLSIVSILALIAIYIFILKNPKLLILSVCVLGFSISTAAAATALMYGHIATLALAFGAGIASIAEDYLFLLYLKKNFATKSFNKEVFFGFLATFLSLFTLSILADGLIAQISFFTACAVAVSYVAFSYLPYVFDFSKQGSFAPLPLKPQELFSPYLLVFLSIVLVAVASVNIKADLELRNLDYDNKALKAKSAFFESLLGEKESVIVEAKTKDELLEKTNLIKQKYPSFNSISDFIPSKTAFAQRDKSLKSLKIEEIKQKIEENAQKNGFKTGYFANSYDFLKYQNFVQNEQAVKELGYEIKCDKNGCYTGAQIKNSELQKAKSEFEDLYTPKELITQMTKAEFKRFIVPSLVAALIIVLVLAYKSRRNFIFALNFILFPLSVILLYLAFIGNGVNLMHLFGLFLVVIYGIDYGIYLEKGADDDALRAVFYSLFTTFAGFGILVFSDINAVSSIGEVVCIGIVSLFGAIFQKRVHSAN